MSRQLKALMMEVMRSRYEGVEEACVVDIMGLNVADTMQFRRALTAKNMRVMVVKNSTTRRAFMGGPLEPIGKNLNGPCALVTGAASVIDLAREVVSLAKDLPRLELKVALMAGESEVMPVREVAGLKGHGELMGELAMLVSSPGRSIAGCLSSAQSRLAGCLKAMAEKEVGIEVED